MKKEGICTSCKFELANDFCQFSWRGEPFGKVAPAKICSYCGYLIRPQVVGGFAIMGTNGGDIFSQSEMKSEGFTDKKRLTSSINAVGKILGLTPKEISKKLKG